LSIVVPDRYLLAAGAGDAAYNLNAFDRALISAGIGNCNIVKVTSIMPPRARPGALADLPFGGVVYAAIGSHTSNESGRLISAAVAVGFPTDETSAGVIMEGSFDLPALEAERQVREMAQQALADRNLKTSRIESLVIEHRVRSTGSALAAVLLWKSI